MDVPGIVRERLADERRMTSVNVGGDDRVYVTPPRTLVYHASGLFSRESIEEYPHDAGRFDVSADRREANFAFEYDDGVRAFSIPRERIETVLPPVLAGVLRTTGLIDDEESIEESYRFGERTLVVTDSRLLTSVGEAVWDRDHESYAYENITGLRFEGALVIDIDGQPRRLDLAGEGRREAYETLEAALCAYHGIGSVEELPGASPERSQQPHTDRERSAAEWTEPEGGQSAASERPTEIDDAESTPESSASPPPSSPAPSSPPPDGTPTEPPIREAPEPSERETPAETTHDPTVSDSTVSDSTVSDSTVSDPTISEPEETGTASDAPNLAGELDALRESVERQTELLENHQELLERVVDELGGNQDTIDDQQVSNDRRVSDDQ